MTNVRLHIMSPPACIFSIVHSAQCSKIQFLYIKHIFRIARNIHVKNVEIKISQTFIRLQIAIDCTPYSLHDRLNSLMVFHTNQVSTSFTSDPESNSFCTELLLLLRQLTEQMTDWKVSFKRK